MEQYVEAKKKDGTIVRRGPYLLYSYKDKGKTVSRRLASPVVAAACRKEIGEFRKFEALCEQWVEVSQKICDLQQTEDAGAADSQEKKRRSTSAKRSKRKSGR